MTPAQLHLLAVDLFSLPAGGVLGAAANMPVFEYSVRPMPGRPRTGTIAADSARQARDRLRADGVAIESIRPISVGQRRETATAGKPAAKQGRRGLIDTFFARRQNASVSWFVRELATLLSVGTPVVESIQLAIDQSRGRFRTILLDVRERVTQGESLGSALRTHVHIFGDVLCEMVRVGEQSGSLPSVLAQAADFRDRRDRLKNRVLSALLYPALVLTLSVGVTLFLMTVVVPTLINSLTEMQRELPLPTAILKGVSDFLLRYGVLLATAAMATLGFGFAYIRSAAGRQQFDRFLLSAPLLKTLIVKQNCSRLCLVTATLLRSGVELVRAMEIAEGAVGNSVIRRSVAEARSKIAAGVDLGAALRADGVLPAALVQVFALGQHTGQLDALLFRIAEDYDSQVAMLADWLTTIMEPVLIVALSVTVGFIMLATLLPILETGNVLSE